MNSIFKMQLKVFSLPQAQLFDTNIYLTLLDVTANIWHTYFVVTLSTGGHKHTNFMAVERWIDYNSTHYGIMRRGQKVWGDMRTDGLVDERKYCMMTTKWYEHMLFFGRGGMVNPPLTNSDWSVRSTSMFPGKEGLGGEWRSVHGRLLSQVLLTLTGQVVLKQSIGGETMSHANQSTLRWKHSHLKCRFCHLLSGFHNIHQQSWVFSKLAKLSPIQSKSSPT